MDPVVHFEIPAEDIERAKEFYAKCFSWSFTSYPEMQYYIVNTIELDEKMTPKKPGAINGGMMKKSNQISSPVITINVENIEESMEKIKEQGGEIIMGKQTVGDMGYSAYFKDTEGNIMGLWQMIKK